MRTSLKFFSFAVLLVLSISLGTPTARAQMSARIIRINGDAQQATVTNPGIAPVIAIQNLQIFEGASIETRAGVELYVETFPGAVATIRPNSLVRFSSLRLVAAGADAGKRAAELELQRGSVISTLDPSKQAITKYGIKTPRGVAAARGTVYGVSVIPAPVAGNSSGVLVLSGTIVIDRGPGVPPITIPFGQAALDEDELASPLLSALISRSPGMAADVLAAVGVVATNVASATSAAGSADNATNLLASVTSAAVRALPGQAPAIVQTMVGAIVAPGSAVGGSPQAALRAVSAVTDAAVRAVIASGGGLSQAGAAAQGAAHGIVQARMADAMNAARAANPGLSPAQLLAAANQAAGSETVTSALSVIGNVATGTAVRLLGQSGDAGGAAATANGIGQAASTGASGGALAALAGAGVPAPGGGFAQPTVQVSISTGQGSGVTTVATIAGSSSSNSSWTGAGSEPVTTQTSGPGGQTTTVVPPVVPGKPSSSGPGSGPGALPPTPNVTPLLPINPGLNVSPSGG